MLRMTVILSEAERNDESKDRRGLQDKPRFYFLVRPFPTKIIFCSSFRFISFSTKSFSPLNGFLSV